MTDLTTSYLGLRLRSPIVASASPITRDLASVQQLIEAGAAAIVLPSLFEEEIVHEEVQLSQALEAGSDHFAEALDYFPSVGDVADAGRRYLGDLQRIKAASDVPVIGSLNATSRGGWIRYARLIEEAGADAIELNLYHVAADPDRSGADVESADLDVVAAVRAELGIPLAVKLSPYYSAVAAFATGVAAAGADGLVLFNRFYQPDLDLDTLDVVPPRGAQQPVGAAPADALDRHHAGAASRPLSRRVLRHHRWNRRGQGTRGGRRCRDDDVSLAPTRARAHPHARSRAARLDGGPRLRLGHAAAGQRKLRHLGQPVSVRTGELSEDPPFLDRAPPHRGPDASLIRHRAGGGRGEDRRPHLALTFGGDDGGMGPRVLLAEDDRAIRESLTLALELEGHEVEAVTDGGHALEAIMASEPDLIVLDWMMPGVDGLSVCRRIRSGGSAVPILMLTARTDISDRVSGLDAGADDYLAKPFCLDELLARVRALIRRSGSEASDRRVRVADLLVDPAARRAWRGARELKLTRTEFDLLLTLVRNAGAVCTHTAIYNSAWNYDFGPDSKTLAVYVGYLRRKLEEGGERRLIHTVRGVGYTLRAP